jgi:transposase
MDRVFVGVDISKDSFSAAGLDAEGNECFSGSYSMDYDGFSQFLEILTTRFRDLQKILVGMESTGCYHINLFSFLTSRGIQAVVINPLLIANFAKRSLSELTTRS